MCENELGGIGGGTEETKREMGLQGAPPPSDNRHLFTHPFVQPRQVPGAVPRAETHGHPGNGDLCPQSRDGSLPRVPAPAQRLRVEAT